MISVTVVFHTVLAESFFFFHETHFLFDFLLVKSCCQNDFFFDTFGAFSDVGDDDDEFSCKLFW